MLVRIGGFLTGRRERHECVALLGTLCLTITLPALGQSGLSDGASHSVSSAQSLPPPSPGEAWHGAIHWRSGTTESTRNSAGQIVAAVDGIVAGGARHVVAHFDHPITAAQHRAMESAGLTLLSYLGDNAYFATVAPDRLDVAALTDAGLMDVQAIQRRWKLHPLLAGREIPTWAVVAPTRGAGHDPAGPEDPNDPVIAAYAVFHPDVPLERQAMPVCRQHRATLRSTVRTVNALVIELPYAQIAALADEDAVQWLEPALPPLTETNDSNRQITQADEVQAAPYALDGSGVNLLVYDVGGVDPNHPDFENRLILGDDAAPAEHSTHVAGTAAGSGAASAGLYRGMAPGATIVSYALGWEAMGIPLYTDPGDIEHDYRQAMQLYAVDLATNSIGTNTCRNGFDCRITGDYGVTDAVIDAIARGELGRPLILVWANGNERNCLRCRDAGEHTPEGYHSTAPPACAKNHITVGALNSNDDSVTAFTSWGPTDDGRLKPDICGPGCQSDDDFGVTSCAIGGGYQTFCGTSMATPTVAGLTALLLQDLQEQFPERPRPRGSTVKALLAQNAVDLGNPGPDYQTGYGSVRVRDTIDFARTGSFYEEQVDQDETYTFLVTVASGQAQLKVTLVWDDVPGTVNVQQNLINDLDLEVYDPALNRSFPWTLNPSSPGLPAVRTQPDHQNNIEQVVVDAPTAGLWTIRVSGSSVPVGPQVFSICASPNLARDCDNNAVPDDEQILADPGLDCTGNGLLDICEPDCNQNGVADSCDVAGGFSQDCDQNGVPDECQPDCNRNGLADACDIANGTSADCDDNGVPDECQDTTADCNENGVWDACDVAEGTSADANYNGVPDECEESRTIYVDDDGPFDPFPGNSLLSDPDEDGTAEHPYDAIQEAIDAALDGDVVVVADGTYQGHWNYDLDFGGKAVELRSANGPQDCILDCEGAHRGFYVHSGETPATRIEGLKILGGYDGFWGGAIFNEDSSPSVANCIFRNSWAVVGGAVYLRGGAPTFTDCVFRDNWGGYGGGIFATSGSSPTISGCTFEDNESLLGGAAVVMFGGAPRVLRCQFLSNVSTVDSGDAEGGAVLVTGDPVLEGCLFMDNSVLGSGGALFARTSARPTLSNCAFVGNLAIGPLADGGAVRAADSSPTLTGCTLVGNQAENHGGGISFGYAGQPTLLNCIFWENADREGTDESAQIHDNGGFPTVRYCCIQGLTGALGSAGNFDADPLFDLTPAAVGFHLTPGSPCVNAGDPAFLPLPEETDIDGDLRVLFGRLDVGADELAYHGTDCNDNGVPDDQDIAEGTSPDCNGNQMPDECELAFGFAADCNANMVPDACDIAAGTSGDCGGNEVPDECEPDCNDDGQPDDCDIFSGASTDCDDNGVPDECEPDCNANGIPDECDLIAGTSTDFNNNGIPDECESNRIIHVDDDGPHDPGPGQPWPSDPDEDGTSDHPFDSIQKAVDGAISGDVIELADGVYAGLGNRNVRLRGRAITVRSANGPRNCIIDCEDRSYGFGFGQVDSPATRLEGLTITNGAAATGGAVYCEKCSPTIDGCILVGNTAVSEQGGAIMLVTSSAVISNCLIAGNWAERGGGIACSTAGRPTIVNCTIIANEVEIGGGGISCDSGSKATIVNCVLWSNAATDGPQLRVGGNAGEATVSYCEIEGGQADVKVGDTAVLIWGDGNLDADPRFVGGPTRAWTSDAVYDAATRQTTLTDLNANWMPGQLVGKLLQPDVTIYAQGLIAANAATTVTVWGNYASLGLPEVAYRMYDGHLRPCSPCVDAGDNTAVPVGSVTSDLDGQARFVDDPASADAGNGTPPIVDIGAYEYPADCLGDLNADRAVDFRDLMVLLNSYGLDDAGDLNCDGDTNLADLATLLSTYGDACD